MLKNLQLVLLLITVGTIENGLAQCATGHFFEYNGKSYEIVSENRSWADAAACAVAKGGYLVEINDAAEQNAVFAAVNGLNIDPTNTYASDGFGSYVWLGGNDITIEGTWTWNGNNDAVGTPFWLGTANGTAVAAQYNNWGLEPDNWLGAGPNGQDGLGMSIANWQNGDAGEWNDVNSQNALYYVVEFNTLLDVAAQQRNVKVLLYPNPASEYIAIQHQRHAEINEIIVVNALGQQVKTFSKSTALESVYDINGLQAGIYVLEVHFADGYQVTEKFIKK